MAQLGTAAGGAAIGGVIGSVVPGVGTMLGAQIGWALGGVAGALLFPTKQPDATGPRLGDLSVQTSGYGVPVPCAVGIVKLSGNVIWMTDLEERKTTRRQGKGGGGQRTITYSYYANFAVGLCEWLIQPDNPQVLRIWLDTDVVYDSTGSEVTQIPGLVWRFHGGSETQLPDALLEATLGTDAPAHRGLAYIVFEDLPVERFGNRIPNVTVEMVGEATRSFVQVPTVAPDVPLWPSSPSNRTYVGAWGINVAVDHHRGRIYEGRRRTSGTTSTANDEMIRVYDLTTMETLGEYPMGDMVQGVFPPGVTPDDASVGAGIIHLGADGFLYTTGGGYNRVPLFKIDPDSWQAVGVFGNPEGEGFGFGDNGTRLVNPMQITSFQVPRLGMAPRTFVVVQGSYSTTLTIDADTMTYVWGAGDVAIEPPPVPIGLGISPLSFPVQLVPGRVRDDGGVELWCLRAYASPARIEVVRFRYYSGAAALTSSVAMGIFRDDFTAIDIAGEVDAGASVPVLQAAWYDASDDTLVITIAGSGSAVVGYAGFSTFKWQTGASVLWVVSDHALPTKNDGRGHMGRVFGANWGMGGNLYLQAGSGDTLVNAAGADFNNLFWLDERQAVIGYVAGGSGAREIAKRYLDRLAANDLVLGDVVEALCIRAGMEATDIDVSDLSDDLRGYILPRPTSAREAITPLAAAFQFDAAEVDDVMVFRKRGGGVVETIAYEDLIREAADSPVVEEQRAQDADLPRELTVRYLDIERGWEQGAQTWQRPKSPTPTMYGTSAATMDLPIPLTASEARSIARRMLTATWRERTRETFSLGQKYLRLVPTDPVNLTLRDGSVIRCRVLPVQLGANWVTRIEAVTEDAASYGLSATGATGDGWAAPTMPVPYYVRLILPDMALVNDADDLGQAGLREYALVAAYDGDTYRTTVLFRSADLSVWSELGAVTQPVTWGAVLETPAEPWTPWTWDEAGTIEIRLADGEVDSATELEVLNGANVGALVAADGSAEIIQWRDADDLGGGLYSLSGLLRGRRGTEDLISTRAAGNTFVVLDDRFRFQAGTGEAAATRYHRAVTVYDSVETAPTTVTKAARGRAEKPYAPAHVTGTRDGGLNLSLAWLRRTRVGGEWLDGTGTVPLSEASEAYEVDVLNGGGTVVRTITGLTSAAATYLAAQQVTDFGSAQASVAVRVYQLSGIVGRGIAAEATV